MARHHAPRGTRDFLPAAMAVRNHVERVVRAAFEAFGYQQVQTPVFEHYELLAARTGEAIQESLFTFAADTGRYALRPELTSPVCRLAAAGELAAFPRPCKLYYLGPCFRYCRPQPGRHREFYQAGVELLGSSELLADAEVIAVAVRVLRDLGVAPFRLRLGHVGASRGWPGVARRDLDRLGEWLRGPFQVTDFEVAPEAASPLDYYTGAVFEIDTPLLNDHPQLAAGGRYDRLVEELDGRPTPATGFAFSFDRMVEAFERSGGHVDRCPVEVVVIGGTDMRRAVEVAGRLREAGLRVGVDLLARGRDRQLAYAEEVGAPFAVLPEPAGDRCQLRHLPTGTARVVDLAAVPAAVRSPAPPEGDPA